MANNGEENRIPDLPPAAPQRGPQRVPNALPPGIDIGMPAEVVAVAAVAEVPAEGSVIK